eukprot:sb/3470922/
MTVNLDILKLKLCNAIDTQGQVIDNSVVLEIITQLLSLEITTEELERTRLGRFVNLIRKNSTEPDIANKARSLVKKWKKLLTSSRPELANGFRRKKRDDSRESTPVGARSDTPISLDCDSRDATPIIMTNGHHKEENGKEGHPEPPVSITSSKEGVQYQDTIYPWTETIPISSSQQENEDVPRYVILPYVSLDL